MFPRSMNLLRAKKTVSRCSLIANVGRAAGLSGGAFALPSTSVSQSAVNSREQVKNGEHRKDPNVHLPVQPVLVFADVLASWSLHPTVDRVKASRLYMA